MTQALTKQRLLDAAEGLFSEQGIGATSLRAITATAGANLAGVNYHFGSKAGLVQAVIARHLEPVIADRRRRFEALTAAPGEPVLDELLYAFLRPAFRISDDGGACCNLLGRLQWENHPSYRPLIHSHFEAVATQFFPQLARACPDLDTATFLWRMHFLIGSLGHTLADFFDMRTHTAGQCDPRDAETATQKLVEFAVAGLRAPISTTVSTTVSTTNATTETTCEETAR